MPRHGDEENQREEPPSGVVLPGRDVVIGIA